MDSIDETLIQWCHPCGDDYYLYPEDKEYNDEMCEDYIIKIKTDEEFFNEQ